MIVCIISALLLIPLWTVETIYSGSKVNWSMVALSAIILFNGIFALGLGLAIATIAESTLYQKQKQQVADLMED